MSPRLESTTEPEARERTRRDPGGAPVTTGSAGEPPLAGVGRRVGAYLLDALAVSLVAGVAAAVVAAATGLPDRYAAILEASTAMGADAAARDVASAATTVSLVGGVVALLAWVGLAVWEGSTGATVGNRLLGIRTHDAATGNPPGFGRALLRWVVLWLSGIVPVAGTVLVLLSPLLDGAGRRQGWHDKVTGTVAHDVRGVPPRTFAPAIAPSAAPAPDGPSAGPLTAPPPGGPRTAGSLERGPVSASGAGVPGTDPWSFPAPARPATGGLITGVPRPGAPATPAPGPSPDLPPVAPPDRPADVPQPVQAEAQTADEDAEDLEATRFSVSSRRSTGDAVPAQPATTIELTSGQRVRVGGRTLVGRNPQPRDGHAELLRVEDPTRSVSKTHLELVPTPDGLRVTDLASTNGSAVITPAGEVHELAPGTPFTVTTGWAVQAGDVRFTVVGPVEA
jgi:uncharacterized RDD family membrane protein YckC